MENNPPKEQFLPKPQTDLPLPRPPATDAAGNVGQAEKEIPAHLQGHALQNKTKWLILFLVLAAVIFVGIAGAKYYLDQQKLKAINDFETCAAAGFPIMESYPARCATPDGRSFTQVLSEEEQKNLLPPEDQSADWETSNSPSNLNWNLYSNKKLGYNFEIPSDWINTGYVGDTGDPLITFNSPDYEEMESERPKGATVSILRYITKETDVKNEYTRPHGGGEYTNLSYVKVDEVNAIKYNHNWQGESTVTSFIKDGYLYQITIENLNGPLTPYLNTYNKIISSFKFIANPTESMTACTMEAKICPDGVTSVGRTGLKCEFEKCPSE